MVEREEKSPIVRPPSKKLDVCGDRAEREEQRTDYYKIMASHRVMPF
jgi:hypothetical protein